MGTLTFIYDTETTAFANTHKPLDHPERGRCVWFAGIVLDGEKEIMCASLIQKPDRWKVTDGAAKIHGITTEIATRYGVPNAMILATYFHMMSVCDEAMSFNLEFDDAIMDTEIKVSGRKPTVKLPGKRNCIMRMATPIMKLPPTPKMVAKNMGHQYKNPSLMEAHQHFCGEGFDGAHGALADCRAAARVLIKIRGQGELA